MSLHRRLFEHKVRASIESCSRHIQTFITFSSITDMIETNAQTSVPRLGGGARTSNDDMCAKAIRSAWRHGINLKRGRQNPGIGNCSIEVRIFNYVNVNIHISLSTSKFRDQFQRWGSLIIDVDLEVDVDIRIGSYIDIEMDVDVDVKVTSRHIKVTAKVFVCLQHHRWTWV